MLNKIGQIIKGEIEDLIETEIIKLEKLPMYRGEEMQDTGSKRWAITLIQNKLFTALCDLLNLYINQWQYGEPKEEKYILTEFIKYAELALKKNEETLDRLAIGHDFYRSPLVKEFRERKLIQLIESAKVNDRESLHNFIIHDTYYSSVYNNQLEKYNQYNTDYLNSVMTFSEAAQKWGLGESTLRSMVNSNRLEEEKDYRKSGKVWLIKESAMIKLYGEPKEE